jgi:hypothetical protein
MSAKTSSGDVVYGELLELVPNPGMLGEAEAAIVHARVYEK